MTNKTENLRPEYISAEDWECLHPSEQHTRLAAGVLADDLGRAMDPANRKKGARPGAADEKVGFEILLGFGIIAILTVAGAVAWFLWAVILSTPAHPG